MAESFNCSVEGSHGSELLYEHVVPETQRNRQPSVKLVAEKQSIGTKNFITGVLIVSRGIEKFGSNEGCRANNGKASFEKCIVEHGFEILGCASCI